MAVAKGFGIQKMLNAIDAARQLYSQQQAKPFFGFEQGIGERQAQMQNVFNERLLNPEINPLYNIYEKQIGDDVRSRFAAIGSPSSGGAQVAYGQAVGDMSAKLADQDMNRLMAASQFRGILPTTQEPQYFNAMVGGHNARANMIQALAALETAKNSSQGGGGGMGFSDLLGAGLGLLGGPTKALGSIGSVLSNVGDITGLTGLSQLGGQAGLMSKGYNGWANGFDLFDQGFWGAPGV